MKLSTEDQKILEELCVECGVDVQKVLKMLDIVKEHEFRERRAGIYESLKEVLKSKSCEGQLGGM